jgi:hypothetical protein
MAGSGFETVNSAEGAWAAASGYAKVVDKNYAIYNSFKFDATGSTDHYYQQYFKKVGQYHHVNGAVYYSVFDLFGHWLGYVVAVELGHHIFDPCSKFIANLIGLTLEFSQN